MAPYEWHLVWSNILLTLILILAF